MKRILPASFYNPLTLAGSVVVVFNLAFIVFLLIVDLLANRPRPYSDLIILLILPLFILIGVASIVLGIVRQRRREKAALPGERSLLVVDFNDQRKRKLVILLGGGFTFLTLLYAFGMYQGYEFVESDFFCGRPCHMVMAPEATAHAFSFHAEVGCSACHVGSGTQYFVLAKLKGTTELYSLLSNTFPRPIPVPVKDLRPSKDICEDCHGPKYNFRENLEGRTFYLSDDKNTPWESDFLFKMGGKGVGTVDRPPKLHWHSTIAREIEYATADPKENIIPWVRSVGLDGKETIYYSKDSKSRDKVPTGAQKHPMDCVGCHNRTGHPFLPADMIVNVLISKKLIDSSLPGIKRVAVKALEDSYATQKEGFYAIGTTISNFYQKNYPDIYSSKNIQINKAIGEIQNLYKLNYDPALKVSWKNFPDNRGHMYSPGCFRCHDGNHVSNDGKVLSKDCSLCHILIRRRMEEKIRQATLTMDPYPHPVDIGDSYKEMNCSDCHGASH
jgi:hypothetical protein